MERSKDIQRSPISKKGVRGPATHDLDNGWIDFAEEKFCGTSDSKGVSSDVRESRSFPNSGEA
jgi:hypothetical protein